MSRAQSSSSASTVGIKDTDGNLLVVNPDGSINTSSTGMSGFNTLSPGYPTQLLVDTAASTVLLPANNDRVYAHIFNNSAAAIYIQFQAPAALNQGIRINPGNYYVIDKSSLWLGAVNAIALVSNQLIDVLEGI